MSQTVLFMRTEPPLGPGPLQFPELGLKVALRVGSWEDFSGDTSLFAAAINDHQLFFFTENVPIGSADRVCKCQEGQLDLRSQKNFPQRSERAAATLKHDGHR